VAIKVEVRKVNGLISFIFFVFFPLLAFSETYQYELKGPYRLDSSRQKPVSYTLKWSEENGRINGLYSDNHFVKSADVTGESSDIGRTFIVKFPEVKNGVRSITILTPLPKGRITDTRLPVSLITRDERGNPLTTFKADSQFTTTSYRSVAQLQEENRCTEGFGVLAGYCGIYAGLITEERDRRNKCNLLFLDAVRLELTEDSSIILHLAEVNEFINIPSHLIGRLPVNPQKNWVDLMNRVCGPLTGMNSSSDNCKIIHLRGDFSQARGLRRFRGTYTISEEGTNNYCRYGLSMDKLPVAEAQ
jgi:hypothetical protein